MSNAIRIITMVYTCQKLTLHENFRETKFLCELKRRFAFIGSKKIATELRFIGKTNITKRSKGQQPGIRVGRKLKRESSEHTPF